MIDNRKIKIYTTSVFLIFLILPASLSAQPIPPKFIKSFKNFNLNNKYEIVAYLKQSFLQADFDGDGVKDVAALVVERKTKKKGILLISGDKYFVFGAGTKFGNGSDDFKWAGGWKIYNKKIAYETVVNTEGDLIGSKKKRLERTAFYIYQAEDNEPVSGGIIYWSGKSYLWIQQGD
jgi:hypothetical protein